MEHHRKYLFARGLLEQMAGWLDGYVQQTRMHAEAEAYAKARVAEERKSSYQG